MIGWQHDPVPLQRVLVKVARGPLVPVEPVRDRQIERRYEGARVILAELLLEEGEGPLVELNRVSEVAGRSVMSDEAARRH
jgi:hypothetical protein